MTYTLEQMADREAIRTRLYDYARGVDRLDRSLVEQAIWPDATLAFPDHGFTGDREAFIDWCWPLLRSMNRTQHMLCNIRIKIDGDDAAVETYLQGYHEIADEGGVKRDLMIGARYLDRFEKRENDWRIVRRELVQEWMRQYPDTQIANTSSARGDADPSYRLFA